MAIYNGNPLQGGAGVCTTGVNDQLVQQMIEQYRNLTMANTQLYPPAQTQTLTTTGIYYPQPSMPQAIPPHMNLFIATIANGFLVYLVGEPMDNWRYCKDYAEVGEAIVAIMAFKQLTK